MASIRDIAKMAGVSVGTVDRVIHNRGRVSAANYTRVMTVLKEVDYRPNMVARSLASKKVYHIVVIIPAYAPGEYWEYISRGVDRAVEDFRQYHLSVTKLYFDQFNEASFESLLRDIKLDEVDGVLLGTLFYDLVCSFSKELDARKIPYVYVDSESLMVGGPNPAIYIQNGFGFWSDALVPKTYFCSQSFI